MRLDAYDFRVFNTSCCRHCHRLSFLAVMWSDILVVSYQGCQLSLTVKQVLHLVHGCDVFHIVIFSSEQCI